MSELSLPRTLIVIQVIFGQPLRRSAEFRGGDVGAFTAEDIDHGNTGKVIDNLVQIGWLKRHDRPERTPVRAGRPSRYIYSRTQAGEEGYAALKRTLSRYGISLS